MAKNNLDIFITAYKDFTPVVHDEVYKVIDTREIDQSEYPLTDRFFSEVVLFFHIAEKMELKDYIGISHYRKYFNFMDDIPDVDKIFENCDAVLPSPTKFAKNIKEQYGCCHNIEDLEIVMDIIDEKYPEYSEVSHLFFEKSKILFSCNMFIMKKEDFLEYVEFLRGILYEYLNRVGTDIYKRIEDNKDKYLKNSSKWPNMGEPWYQYRIGGYLAERLSNVFYLKKFKKIKMFPIKVTEAKYSKGITDEDI